MVGFKVLTGLRNISVSLKERSVAPNSQLAQGDQLYWQIAPSVDRDWERLTWWDERQDLQFKIGEPDGYSRRCTVIQPGNVQTTRMT